MSESSVLIEPTNRINIGSSAEFGQFEFDNEYYTTGGRSDSGAFRVRKQSYSPSRRENIKTGKTTRVSPEERRKVKRSYEAAMNAARRLEEASLEEGNRIVHIRFEELAIALDRMWELRKSKDIDWVTILNHMQSLVKQAEREDIIASLTSDQCTKIREIIERCLSVPTKTRDELKEAIKLIQLAGFDPYYMLSEDNRKG